MTIGLDIGNSSIKSAIFFEDDIGEPEHWEKLEDIIQHYGNVQYFACSVGMKKSKIQHTIPGVVILDRDMKLPLKIDYDSPETLGLDRIAAAVGAWSLFPKQNLLIIDGGTCITYDIVTEHGHYLGGIIAPGWRMRLKAMHHFTENLPNLEPFVPEESIGKTTESCMQIGAYAGVQYEIEQYFEFFNKKFKPLQVVVTGGQLPSFESSIKAHIFASSKIVLMGLHAIWKLNEAS
jgi:type III pantothenate kinase